MPEPKIPIWTVKINGQTFWTDSEEGAKAIMKAIGGCEYEKMAEVGWFDIVNEANKLATGIKNKICPSKATTICNLVACNRFDQPANFCARMNPDF